MCSQKISAERLHRGTRYNRRCRASRDRHRRVGRQSRLHQDSRWKPITSEDRTPCA